MKKAFLFISILFFLLYSNLSASGVMVVDAKNGIYLTMISSEVSVSVENQVAVITAVQTFKNNLGADEKIKYAFPMPEDGSATELKWKVSGIWYTANFKPGPQDTTLPGGGGVIHPNLSSYLGGTPLYFNIEDSLKADSSITVQLTYVQLLKYEFGTVKFEYPNDYSLIQEGPVTSQILSFKLLSGRTIDSLSLLSHTAQTIQNYGDSAFIYFSIYEQPADKNYVVHYSLNPEELGLFGMSTVLPDSLVPDSLQRGFFLFVAEPNPPESTDIINKVFTLIIDRSGSMSGTKMEQAKNAAKFIVENLNEGDKFNIIDFDDIITLFRESHVPFNQENKEAALVYIAGLGARGMTDICGAFAAAIPQFSSTDANTANIIIFLTDGQATAGITSTPEILQYINDQINLRDTTLTIFNFGIGLDVNHQLLTLMAAEHNGLAEFLENDEVQERITSFYMKIRNPVLLNTKVEFQPYTVADAFPNPLPNLYKGQQLLVSGRYTEAAPVNVKLTGTAFGQPAEYNYQLSLSNSDIEKNRFLTKIWAKLKIENLLVHYYSLDAGSDEAAAVKDQIIDISLKFGVLSPFTNLSGDNHGGGNASAVEQGNNKIEPLSNFDFELTGNFPNPFNPGTKIIFIVNKTLYEAAVIRIYNMLGELIREYRVFINGKGLYEVYWNGLTENGNAAPSGNYIYVVSLGNTVLSGKMCLLK
ncbi:MAG TPA: VWA domain-containing protein [Ignavibacteriaceae bacterium]|nr:VWA domain-containing protein [Ignavibacteriaceae bacterium]